MTTGTPEPAPGGDGLDGRVSALESGQQTIMGKLDQLLGFHDKKPAPPAEPERPEVSIAEEIRRQLSERDAKAPPAPDKAPAAEPEKPPKPPARRVTRAMWGDE
jgi:hypothetical protein